MSTYYRKRGDDYYEDDVYTNTRDNQKSTALVRRRNDSPDSIEDVRRDFSPGGGYYRETITRKSGIRPAGRSRSYDDDRYYEDDRSYASTRRDSYRRGSRYDDDRRSRRGRRDTYSDYSSSRSRTPPKRRNRRKSMPEEAMEALGLGGVVAALTGKKHRSRSRSSSSDRRSHRSRSRRDRSQSKSRNREQFTQALKAAVLAGAGVAIGARHEQGGWQGEKGKRVLTAVLTAGGTNGLINQYKDPEKHKLRDTLGAAAAGIAADRLVNGRSQSRGRDMSPDSRRSGRSRSRSKVRDVVAGGAIAATAKKIADGFRSHSQSRGRDRSRSPSYDSYADGPAPRRKSRSRSIIARTLSKVGLDSQADKIDPAGARERSLSRGPARRRSHSRSRYADDDYYYYDDDDPRRQSSFDGRGSSIYGDNRDVGPQLSSSRPRSLSRARSVGAGGELVPRPNSVGPGGGALAPPPPGYSLHHGPQRTSDPETDSDSDLGSSSEDDKLHKKSRKKLLITGGLATVASIHAGRSVYETIEKRKARKRAVKKGLMSKEEAQKHKMRDRLSDAASVGLAGLGIKGAYSEWKEMKEKQEEWKEAKERAERHRRKRAARRAKMRLVGMEEGYSNSAPTLSDPFYGDAGYDADGRQRVYHGSHGPYMSGGAGLAPHHPHSGGPSDGPSPLGHDAATQYFDGNPYAAVPGSYSNQNQNRAPPSQPWQQQQQQQQQHHHHHEEDYDDGLAYGELGYQDPAPTNFPTAPPPPQNQYQHQQRSGTGYPQPPMGELRPGGR